MCDGCEIQSTDQTHILHVGDFEQKYAKTLITNTLNDTVKSQNKHHKLVNPDSLPRVVN